MTPLLLPFASPLLKGSFQQRYKRFFVDMGLAEGGTLTIHCANSGSMKSCLVEGAGTYALDSGNPERKLRHSLELLELSDGLACLNTARANALTERFLLTFAENQGSCPNLRGLPSQQVDLMLSDFGPRPAIRREAKYNAETRFDFCLEGLHGRKTWLEVKSVSLRLDEQTLAFPDAVTERGQKHIRHLVEAVEAGDSAILLFALMRGASLPPEELSSGFRAAHEIDPTYAALLTDAKAKGVKVRILVPSITPEGLGVRGYFAWP